MDALEVKRLHDEYRRAAAPFFPKERYKQLTDLMKDAFALGAGWADKRAGRLD